MMLWSRTAPTGTSDHRCFREIFSLVGSLNIDGLRARLDGALASVYLHGKVLYALMVDRRVRRLAGDGVHGNLDGPRKMTRWRV